MQGSIYIRETGPNAVTMDMTASPSELAYKETAQGFAFQKTLEHLGLQLSDPAEHLGHGALKVEGDFDTVRQNVGQLQRHIGVIARYSSQKADSWHKYQQDFVGRTLGHFVQKDLPALPDNTTLMRVVGMAAEPFAQETNDNGVAIVYARLPHWTEAGKHDRAKDTDGSPLKPFHTRDIGGFLIDASGCEAQDTYGASIMLPEETKYILGVVGRVRDRRLGFADEFRDAFSAYMGTRSADRPEGILRPRDVDSAWKESSIRIRRQDLATFSDENEGAKNIEARWLSAVLGAAQVRINQVDSDPILKWRVLEQLEIERGAEEKFYSLSQEEVMRKSINDY